VQDQTAGGPDTIVFVTEARLGPAKRRALLRDTDDSSLADPT